MDEAQPWGADPIEVLGRLNGFAQELETVSNGLVHTERRLEPLERWYREEVDAFELKLWHTHIDSDLKQKFPPEALRLKLARAAVKESSEAHLDLYEKLLASRKRSEQRLRDLRLEIDAQRSVLSALKVLAEVQ